MPWVSLGLLQQRNCLIEPLIANQPDAVFVLGLKVNDETWRNEKHKQVYDMLMPVFFLANPSKYDEALQNRSKAQIEGIKMDFIQEIPDLIARLQQYWAEQGFPAFSLATDKSR